MHFALYRSWTATDAQRNSRWDARRKLNNRELAGKIQRGHACNLTCEHPFNVSYKWLAGRSSLWGWPWSVKLSQCVVHKPQQDTFDVAFPFKICGSHWLSCWIKTMNQLSVCENQCGIDVLWRFRINKKVMCSYWSSLTKPLYLLCPLKNGFRESHDNWELVTNMCTDRSTTNYAPSHAYLCVVQ
jgi:hypothetical protein